MIAATKVPCLECGHANGPEDLSCRLCGRVLRHQPRDAPAPVRRRRRPIEPRRETARHLFFGAVAASVFAFGPLLRYMGWFFGSLCHEIGHVAAAWLAGCPAVPAIRLDGHAAAVHGEQQAFLCVILWGGLGWLAWRFRETRSGRIVFGAAVLLYPVFAFTGLREFVFLLAGHAGELAFAGVFFWRGLAGTLKPPVVRIAYAAGGWFLLGRNLALYAGLVFDASARTAYLGNGSFGLANDFLRVGRMLGVGFEPVAGAMMLVALAVLPVAWRLSRPWRGG